MDSITIVRDIMTSDVLTVSPDASVLAAAKILTEHKFNGLPVVDENHTLVGLLTEYNIIHNEVLIHAPMMSNAQATADPVMLAQQMQKISLLKVKDVMEKDPLTLSFDDTFETVMDIFIKHHRVNPLPVIDKSRKLVGVVSRSDLLKLLKVYGHN